jgi:hypothetical protein
MTKNRKNLQPKKRDIFLSKIAIYLSLDLHKGHTSHRRNLQPSKENIQHFRTWEAFVIFFYFLWFALLDPDPDFESGSGYTDLIESGPGLDKLQ